MRYFSEDHTWVDIEGDQAVVGITQYAADELGDVNFVELPDVGVPVVQGEPVCVVESVKTASDIIAPVSGTIIEVNEILEDEPELASSAADTDGWIFKINELQKDEFDVLMDEAKYDLYTADEDGDL